MSLRRVRDQVRELRAEIDQPQRLIAVSTAAEADEVQGRLGTGNDALIVIAGVPLGS